MAEPSPASLAGPAEIAELEALGRRAWPALEVEEFDGWQLGSSGRHTRRANSTSPVSDGRGTLEERLKHVEAFYASRDRPAIFKLTAAAPCDLDRELMSRGYARESETIVMTLDPGLVAGPVGDDRDTCVRVGTIDPEWLAASLELSQIPHDRRDDYRAILERMCETTDAQWFGLKQGAAGPESVAFACITGSALSIQGVATAPSLRGRGLAEVVVRQLFDAARTRSSGRGGRGRTGGNGGKARPTAAPIPVGAARESLLGLLSVESENVSARRLYERLGFVERYRYWYRVRPARRPS